MSKELKDFNEVKDVTEGALTVQGIGEETRGQLSALKDGRQVC